MVIKGFNNQHERSLNGIMSGNMSMSLEPGSV